MRIKTKPLTLEQQFHLFAKTWHQECDHLSFIRERVEHYAYQHIIDMGPAVVPYILEELEQRPDHWFHALRAITGEDPVRRQSRGKICEMTRDWLDWGRKKGLLQPKQSISHAEALQMQSNQIVIAQAVRLLAFHVEQLRRSHDPEAVVEMGTVRNEMAKIIGGTGKEEGKEEK